jgi:hypothetical protein
MLLPYDIIMITIFYIWADKPYDCLFSNISSIVNVTILCCKFNILQYQ